MHDRQAMNNKVDDKRLLIAAITSVYSYLLGLSTFFCLKYELKFFFPALYDKQTSKKS